MNSKELIKKIDIGRVGNGSVSYNDMCLVLNKEETLELLQYIEQLEIANKNNEGLVRENVDLINRNLKLQEELKRCQDTIKKWMDDHKQLIIDNGKMKRIIKENFSVYDDEVIFVSYYPNMEEEIKEVLENE